jgi:acetoin utilization deacetylase AcuC-like enzyme
MRVGIVYDKVFLSHDTGLHLESPRRLESVISYLETTRIKSQLVPVPCRTATQNELRLVHDQPHISRIQDISLRGGGHIDSDTVVSSGSYEAAAAAAGGLMEATRAVLESRIDRAFALVRPPGHHATPTQAMGFCLFNNIAIATKYAMARFGLKRVLIIDFDVHHGNGTQTVFERDPRVAYISLHEHPFYPGSGAMEDTGIGDGKGSKVNIPLPSGCGDSDYLLACDRVVVPFARRFNPELIMVSAGYDSHWLDDIGMMEMSVTGFAQIMIRIRTLAEELCHGRLVLTLEGGYNLDALAASVKSTFDVLLGSDQIDDPLGSSPHKPTHTGINRLVQRVKDFHSL